MAKSVTSIVSVTGLIQSIIINLVRRVESLGGTEDDVLKLTNPEDPIVQRVAETILQSLGKIALPVRFKNWKTICSALRLDTIDHSVVWANATADAMSDLGRRLAAAFPEFWSETETQWPVPWSLLKEKAVRENLDEFPLLEVGNPDHFNRLHDLVLSGAIDGHDCGYRLPVKTFVVPGTPAVNAGQPLLPGNLSLQAKVGDKVSWCNRECIVVQNFGFGEGAEGEGNFSIVPAECIAMDL